jgi:hypothetical protein
MKKIIINKFGDNHIEAIELLDAVENEPYGLYTYEGEVYILKDGEDFNFDELTLNEKTNIINQISSNRYIINLILQ